MPHKPLSRVPAPSSTRARFQHPHSISKRTAHHGAARHANSERATARARVGRREGLRPCVDRVVEEAADGQLEPVECHHSVQLHEDGGVGKELGRGPLGLADRLVRLALRHLIGERADVREELPELRQLRELRRRRERWQRWLGAVPAARRRVGDPQHLRRVSWQRDRRAGMVRAVPAERAELAARLGAGATEQAQREDACTAQ